MLYIRENYTFRKWFNCFLPYGRATPKENYVNLTLIIISILYTYETNIGYNSYINNTLDYLKIKYLYNLGMYADHKRNFFITLKN